MRLFTALRLSSKLINKTCNWRGGCSLSNRLPEAMESASTMALADLPVPPMAAVPETVPPQQVFSVKEVPQRQCGLVWEFMRCGSDGWHLIATASVLDQTLKIIDAATNAGFKVMPSACLG